MKHFFWDWETFLIQPLMLAPPPVCMSYKYTNQPARVLHANPRLGGDELLAVLHRALTDDDVTMVAHNAAFEAVVLMAWRPDWTTLLFDKLRKGLFTCTMLREKLIRIGRGDHTEGFGLDDCMAAWMLPHVPDKGFAGRTRFGTLWNTPVSQWSPAFVEYSLGDLCIEKLFFAQERAGRELLVDQYAQMRAGVSLQLTSAWGFPVDPVQADVLHRETSALLEQYKVELVRAGLVRVERGAGAKRGQTVFVRDAKAAEALITEVRTARGLEVTRGMPTPKMLLKAYLKNGISPPKDIRNERMKRLQNKHLDEAEAAGVTVPEGNIKLDEDACLKAAHPLLTAYTRFGQASTLMAKIRRLQLAAKSQYQRAQARYNTIVNTGRTSCSQGDDPKPGEAWTSVGMQIQNLPRAGEEYEGEDGKKHSKAGARECFVAPPGWCLVSVDFDAFELRTWSQVCYWVLGYSDLREILNDTQRCPHIELGVRLWDAGAHFNPEGATWREQYAWGYGLRKTDKKLLADVRGNAKGPGFGLPGGMAWARLIDYCWLNYGVLLNEEQARNACRVWRERYAEADPYLDWVKSQVGRQYGAKGTIKQFVSDRLRGDVGYTDGANGFFQGLAADAAKAAGWAVVEECYENTKSPLYGARPVAFVHDEWLCLVRRERLHEAAYRMRDVMVKAAQRYCPDVTITASPSAMLRWSKAAGDPRHNAAGELICYEESL